MKLSELMKDIMPKSDFEGWVTNDDMVLAIGINGTETSVDEYVVAEMGVAGLDAQLNPISQDKIYVRSGQSTTKTGTQRAFKITGDRFIGDPFQDYCFSHEGMYGTGNSVVKKYVYFNILNGKGEQGEGSIMVNSDGSGNAGESSAIDVDFKKAGSLPTAYIYTKAVADV